MGLRPINSVKNVLDSSGGIVATTVLSVPIATAVDAYAGGAVEVPIGAKVFSFYLSVFIESDAAEGVSNLVDWHIAVVPSGLAGLPNPGSTGGNALRKFIIHEEKGLAGFNDHKGLPMIFKGVIKLPRGYQRMSDGMQILFRAFSPTAGLFCIKAIYKFYK